MQPTLHFNVKRSRPSINRVFKQISEELLDATFVNPSNHVVDAAVGSSQNFLEHGLAVFANAGRAVAAVALGVDEGLVAGAQRDGFPGNLGVGNDA